MPFPAPQRGQRQQPPPPGPKAAGTGVPQPSGLGEALEVSRSRGLWPCVGPVDRRPVLEMRFGLGLCSPTRPGAGGPGGQARG
jgi:hypothetical protein